MKLDTNRSEIKLEPAKGPGLKLAAADLTNLGTRKLANKAHESDTTMGQAKAMPWELFLTASQRRTFHKMNAAKREKIIAKIEARMQRRLMRNEPPFGGGKENSKAARSERSWGWNGTMTEGLSTGEENPAQAILGSTGARKAVEPGGSLKRDTADLHGQGKLLKRAAESKTSWESKGGRGDFFRSFLSKDARERLENKKALHERRRWKSGENAQKKVMARDVGKVVMVSVNHELLAEQGKEGEQLKQAVHALRTAKNASTRISMGAKGFVSAGRGAAALLKELAATLGKAMAGLLPVLAAIALLVLFLCAALLLFMDEDQGGQSDCPYGEMYYWIYWETGTWDPEMAYATVHGDNGNAYGIQLDRRYTLTAFVDGCYELDENAYDMFQDYYRKIVPQSDTGFARAWKKACAKNGTAFGELQKQFAYDHFYAPAEAYLKERGLDLSQRPEVVKGAILSFAWHAGWKTAADHVLGASVTGETGDREFLEQVYDKRLSEYPRFTNRFTEERAYAFSLLAGSGAEDGEAFKGVLEGEELEGATYWQKAVVKAALQGSSWGIHQGWCQKWVATTYQKALGGPYVSSCCASNARKLWAVSKDKAIPVGATVYGAHSWSGTICGCGKDAGHVGIYVGNGKIANLGAGYSLTDFSRWVKTYGYGGWGWNGGKDLKRK